MTTSTALSVTHAARVGADLIDRGIAAGLPDRLSLTGCVTYSLDLGHHEQARIQFYGPDFSDVRAWASFLGADAEERAGFDQDGIVFCEAEAQVDGVWVRLTGNMRAAS
jgi:hypothetical protein